MAARLHSGFSRELLTGRQILYTYCMQYRRPAFTLIELLVVIAIIGILSVLVVTQLGNSSIKARNATAQSDIAEMGKAVESFRVDDTSLNQVVSNVPGSIDTLNGATGNISQIFTGTQAVNGASSTYAASVSKTPSTAYTYRYVASGTPAAATASARQLVGAGAGQPLYALCTNLVNAVQPYYCAADGSGAGPSAADQVLAAQGLGNLSAAATNGLAAWYKLDESGTKAVASDSSGSGNNGTLTNFTFNGTTNGWVTGKIGNGLLFNGSNDYVTANVPSSTYANAFTWSLWINQKSSQLGGGIMTQGGSSYFNLYTSGQFIRFQIGNPPINVDTTGNTINTNAWNHIVATYDPSLGSNQMKMYINGTFNGQSTNTSLGGAGSSLRIGNYGAYFNGSIDDVRVYNRALAANEVQQLYQGTL